MLKVSLNKKIVYVYKVEFDNEIIHTVEYFKYDKNLKRFGVCKSNIHTFAQFLINNEFKAFAVSVMNNELFDPVEILPYREKNLPWIRSENTTTHIEFLDLLKKKKIVRKVPLSVYL